MTKNQALRRVRELGGRVDTLKGKTFVRFDQRGCDYWQKPEGTVVSVNGGILFDPPTDDYVRWGVDEPLPRERKHANDHPDVTLATDIAAYDWFHATPSPSPVGYPYHDGDRCQCSECHPIPFPGFIYEQIPYEPIIAKQSFGEARAEARTLGCSLRRKDGEYRVNFLHGDEATAYYTDDLQDALGTARLMAEGPRRGIQHNSDTLGTAYQAGCYCRHCGERRLENS